MSFCSPSRNIFDHVSYRKDFPEEFMCDVCTKPVVLPQMATPCGHSFCGFCVNELGKTVRPISCPMCRQRVDQFCKNIFACKVLSTFQEECLDCNATFTLDMAKDHVNNCPQMEMICSHCNQKVKRGDTALHSDRCVMKEVNCVCGMQVKQKDMNSHKEDSCSWKKISCPLNCKIMIERYLLPSHTLQCPAALSFCPIKGCGAHLRRGDVEKHIDENQPRHYHLLKEDRNDILWRVKEMPLFRSSVKTKRTGQVSVFKWSLVSSPLNNKTICSPVFHKWDRKWRLLCTKREERSEVGLEYSQGVHGIHLALSFFLENQDESRHVHNINVVSMKEGETLRFIKKELPNSVTVRLELVDPAV
ncbi:TNF receptor-associated factor 5-like [Montipora capricornis]|uniref:TNF receptor-associated factor 5-like n=1 Tax=Montipora capricornis TaxID=246305 RepID=UPI0035F165A8